jgi:hypothetical protein
MHMTSSESAERSRVIWQARTARRLTNEDTRQITENLTGFFSILDEWARAESSLPVVANDSAPDDEGVRNDC